MTDGGPEIAIGAVERALLSALLTEVHRTGFGHLTRVLDPDRGDVAGQLRRAGVPVPADFRSPAGGSVVVMISVAARTAAALDLLQRHGAVAVWTAGRAAAPAALLLEAMAGDVRKDSVPGHLAD